MKRILLLVAILGFFQLTSIAQCDDFIIYHTKGNVTFIKGISKGTPRKNMKLEEGTQLVIGTEASVILLSGNDKALRLASPGKLSFGDIHSLCQKNQTSLTKEYMKYVAQSIMEKEEPQTAMVIKGAVYRSRTEFEKTEMILPEDSSVISSDSIRFAWHKPAGPAGNYLLIYENGVKEIFSQQLSDTTITLEAFMFRPQTIYFWLVSPTPKPSDKEVRFTFVYGEKEWKTEFLDEWDKTMKELEGDLDSIQLKMKERK